MWLKWLIAKEATCQLTVILSAVWPDSMICGSVDFVSQTRGTIYGEKDKPASYLSASLLPLTPNKKIVFRWPGDWYWSCYHWRQRWQRNYWPESLWALDGEGGGPRGGRLSHEVGGQGMTFGCAAAEPQGRTLCQSLSSTTAPKWINQTLETRWIFYI